MRIRQVADAAGITPRAVRHYHRLGLLGEPAREANGYRNYTIDDVVRLLRIRWCASNGVPLGSIAAMLTRDEGDGDNVDVAHDLQCLIEIAGAERDAADQRIERLTRMLDAAKAGRRITALPSALSEEFDQLEVSAPDFDVAHAVARDRDLLEALVIGGTVSDEALSALVAVAADATRRAQYVALLGRWVGLRGQDPDAPRVDTEITSIATALAEFSSAVVLPAAPSDRDVDRSTPVSQSVDESRIASAVPDRAQRRAIVRAVRLIANIR